MRETENIVEARRLFIICNSCRYCEGYCSVFPAMEQRRILSAADLSYLANLCHDCRGCFYACQYAPPHEFAVNLPQTLAKVRNETYAEYAWPHAFAKAFERNGAFISCLTALCIGLVIALAGVLRSPTRMLAQHTTPGAFYAVVPEPVILSLAMITLGFSAIALAMSVRNFWRDTAHGLAAGTRSLLRAAVEVLTLRNLGGKSHGCNDRDEALSQSRRYAHHTMFYGFLLCIVSTCSAAFEEHVLGILAPYPFLSVPVLSGSIGGIGILIGAAGLIWIKVKSDPEPAAKALRGNDYALLSQLILASGTGLVLLAVRSSPWMGVALALHLGAILSFFVALPYSKFVHGIYRSAALVRRAAEHPSD